MAERDPAFDLVKFIALVGVIAGHLAGYNVIARDEQPIWLSNLIIGV